MDRAFLGAACALSAVALATPSPGQCPGGETGGWVASPGQTLAGPLGDVSCAVLFDPDGAGPEPLSLVVGGQFRAAGGGPANNIAYWNGSAWKPLGQGLNGAVQSLAVHAGELYAGGLFVGEGAAGAGGTGLNRIARWTGSGGGAGVWAPVGGGLYVTPVGGVGVKALASYGGRLYAAGSIESVNAPAGTVGTVRANGIASWDGTLWRPVGTGGTGGGGGVERVGGARPRVNALAVFDGRLIVGGVFDTINGAAGGPALARWDGAAWSGPGGTFANLGTIPEIQCLGVFTGASSSTLYAGGAFTSISGVAATNLAAYTKAATTEGPWAEVGGALPGPVGALRLVGTTVLSQIVASSTGTAAQGVYNRASGGSWVALHPRAASVVATYGGATVLGLPGLGETGVLSNGSGAFMPLGPGLSGLPFRTTSFNGALVALGGFTTAEGQTVSGSARLSGTAWAPMGAGISGAQSRLENVVDAVEFEGKLYVSTRLATGVQVRIWDGASWGALTLTPAAGLSVSWWSGALRVAGGRLYVCGPNGVSFANVNGTQWPLIITTPPAGHPYDVVDLNGAVWGLGTGGAEVLNVSGWTPSGTTLPAPYGALVRGIVFNGRMIAAASGGAGGTYGIFELIGGFQGIGGTWVRSLGPDVAGPVDFTVFRGRLLMTTGTSLYELTGSGWSILVALEAGLAATPYQNDLIIAGTTTVPTPSPVYARLRCTAADYNGLGTVDVLDIFVFLGDWFAGASKADFNLNGAVDLLDIFVFLQTWFLG